VIQKFICPKCGNAFEVPVEGFGTGTTEVDCPCGASMVPSGGLEADPEEAPHRNHLIQRQLFVRRIWQIVAVVLILAFLRLLFF
jgi:hypothetical protein